MARAVRKVSRNNTKGQKKNRKLSKKWIISICVAVGIIIAGVGIGLAIYFSTKTEDYVSDKIYFTEETSTTDGNKVTFVKENYQTLVRKLDAQTTEHLFVFAYDGSAFYADEADEDTYNKQYTSLITRLADLQYEINEAKEQGINIELYIVDVHVDSSVNAGIMTDTKYFGGLYSEASTTFEPAFFYNLEGEYKETITIGDDKTERTISTKDWANIMTSSIPYAINYINSLSN